MHTVDQVPTLFVFNKTPVKARPGFWVLVLGLWLLLNWLGRWRWPGQSLGAYMLVGGAGTMLGLLADVGHACAHTISARLAKAPMDVILLGADMPRTLYWNNDVSPKAHIGRSLGGPAYSAVGLLLGIVWLLLAPPETAVRYLGEVWTVTNGFIFLALFAPLPIVDGGVILKWTLVLSGRSEQQADQLVQRLGLGLALVLLAGSLLFLLQTAWLPGAILLMIGLMAAGAALKLIR